MQRELTCMCRRARPVEKLERFADRCVQQPRSCATQGVVGDLLENRVRKVVPRAARGVWLFENPLGSELIEGRHKLTLAHRRHGVKPLERDASANHSSKI